MKIKKVLSAFIFSFLFSVNIISCTKSASGSGTPAPAGGSTSGVTININGMTYSPSTTNVKVGTKVTWTNNDGYSAHTATSDDGGTFNSGNINSGSSYSFTPTFAGTFPYHCLVHGVIMAGTLVVTN